MLQRVNTGMKGLFITFEGLDGSGKTTQIRILHDFLKEKGLDVVLTREPGGTEIGAKIRNILLNKKNKGMSSITETLLFLASRAELVSKVISPALGEGKIVICDRFFDSTVVYQGIARELGEDRILGMSLWATADIVPDLTFLLSIKADTCEERMQATSKQKDRIEMEKDYFKEKIYRGYLKIARLNKNRFIILDGGQDRLSLSKKIGSKVLNILVEKELFKKDYQ